MVDNDRVAAALPSYEVGSELGRGACGVVLAGQHRQLGRLVAIKQLPRAFGADPAVRARFLAEARVLATLDHPHVVAIYDFVDQDGLCLLVMERLTGGTVWSRFHAGGFTPDVSCAILLAVCSGLHHAHQHGVLHRDVKPENLMFSGAGTLKVTDLGIAKVIGGSSTLATRHGEILGTPAYIAPEQAQGYELTPATDVYAAGTLLYELLAGRLPFPADADPATLLYRHVHEAPPPLIETAHAIPDRPRRSDRSRHLQVSGRPLPERGGVRCRHRGMRGQSLGSRLVGPHQCPVSASGPILTAALGEALARRADRWGDRGRERRSRRTRSRSRLPATSCRSNCCTPSSGPTTSSRSHATPAPSTSRRTRARRQRSHRSRLRSLPSHRRARVRDDRRTRRLPGRAIGAGGGQAPPPPPSMSPKRGRATREARLRARVERCSRSSLHWCVVAALVGAGVLVAGRKNGKSHASTSTSTTGSQAPAAAPKGSWTQLTKNVDPVARMEAASTVWQGQLWVLGGMTSIGKSTDRVEGYDSVLQKWNGEPSLPMPYHHLMAVTYRNRVVLLGGWYPSGPGVDQIKGHVSELAWEFNPDPKVNNWVPFKSMDEPRAAGAAAVIGNDIIVAGGLGADDKLVNDAEMFDGTQLEQDQSDCRLPVSHLAARLRWPLLLRDRRTRGVRRRCLERLPALLPDEQVEAAVAPADAAR